MLVEAGHRGSACTSAEEGLEIATSEHPGILMPDIYLPGKSGISFTLELRSCNELRNTIIVSISYDDSESTTVAPLKTSADGYLVKLICP